MADPPIRVLVVDDTGHVRRMLRMMLEVDGFEVVGESANGADATRLVAELDPSVVVMDHRLPDTDGVATAEQILAGRPDQLIVLHTAYLDPTLERRARRAGIAVVVGKAEGLETLEREITRLCRPSF